MDEHGKDKIASRAEDIRRDYIARESIRQYRQRHAEWRAEEFKAKYGTSRERKLLSISRAAEPNKLAIAKAVAAEYDEFLDIVDGL